MKTGDEHSLRLMRVAVVLAGVLPLLFLAVAAWTTYGDSIAAAEASLDELALNAERHALRIMDHNEVVMQQMVDLLKDDDDARVQEREQELSDLARAILVRLPHLNALSVWNAEGRLLVSTLPFRRGPASEPGRMLALDPMTGEAQLRSTRSRASATGHAPGSVELTVASSYFSDFYRQLTEGKSRSSAAIVTQDGFIVASWPPALGAVTLPEGSELLRAMKGVSPHGILTGHVFVREDGRYAAFRRVGRHPLFVAVAQHSAALLAEWRRQMLLLSAIVLPVTLALVLVSWLALLRTRSEMQARRRLEEETQQRLGAEEALRHAQKLDALGQLAGGLAHDFNNLLTVVANSAELLRPPGAPSSVRPELATIVRAVKTGSRLTRRLLTFSRRQAPSPEVLYPQAALEDVREILQTTAGRGITIELQVDAETPAIEVDRTELEMALINLVANARDALGHQGTLEIRARRGEPVERPERHPQGYAVISVSDHGPGMSAEVRDRAREAFFTTKPAGHGTGLGLSQVHSFCAHAGGGAEIRSELGAGTTVSMFLPASAKVSPLTRGATTVAEGRQGRLLH